MIKSWLFHDFLEVWGFLLSPQSHLGNETVIWKSPKQKETIYVNRMQGDKGHKRTQISLTGLLICYSPKEFWGLPRQTTRCATCVGVLRAPG